MAPWGIIIATCMLVNYQGHLGWHILEIWDVWLDFKALSDMRDWGVVAYGAFVALLEGGRLMVFFANSYIEARKEEQKEPQLLAHDLVPSPNSVGDRRIPTATLNAVGVYLSGIDHERASFED